MRKRRLLSIGHPYVVGLNRRLAHEMARVGADRSAGPWEVTAVAPTHFAGWGDLRPVTFAPEREEPCAVVPVKAHLTQSPHLFVYGRKLRALMAEPWDLIHCWQEPYVLVAAQLTLWTPRATPLVFATFQNLDKRYPFPFSAIERHSLDRAAGWICFGALVERTLGPRAGYNQRPHARIPPGVDLDAFRPDRAAGEAVLRKLGWDPGGPPVVGYLGRFVAEKGLDVLQSALDGVTSPWRALFVGNGRELASIRAWAERYGDRVRICTDVGHADVPRYLNAMNVLCAPSQTRPNWKEQFGRMIVEAMATGIPFIGSDSGEIPFVVGDAGVIVGERDVPGWTRAISEILEDEPRRAELAARGLARAHAEFSWSAVARKHLDFFDRLVQ